MGVLESVSSLGKPFLPELFIGLTDIVPILIMGVMVSSWVSRDTTKQQSISRRPKVISIFIIAFTYFVGRYFLYTLIHVNSGYFSQTNATFLWTLAFGLAIGLAYYILRDGTKGNTPFYRGLWFGCMAFGLYWALNNFFMPIVFDVSFIQFDPPILNYVYRIIVDVAFVSFGVWIVEKAV
jgi:glucose uptake protein GlcU